MIHHFKFSAFLLLIPILGCGSESSESAITKIEVSSEAKNANAPEKVKGKSVTKSNMPSMKYVD